MGRLHFCRRRTVAQVMETNAPEAIRADYKVLMTDGRREISVSDSDRNPEKACEFLERGGILFFPVSPFKRTPADQSFLLNQKQEDADYRKNIAYRPKEDKVTGAKG